MAAHRRSALLLHGLAGQDRDWVLAQLPEADRAVLQDHLAELRELGIPADPALLPQLDGAGTALGAPGGAIPAGEPAWMMRQLLAQGPAPWRGAWLAGLSPAQRERAQAQPAAALRPAAARSLQRHAQRLAAPPSPMPLASVTPLPRRTGGPAALLAHLWKRWA